MRTCSRASRAHAGANLALAILAVLALSGCAGRSSPTSPAPAPSAAAVKPSETPEPAVVARPTTTAEPTAAPGPTAGPDAVDLAVSVARDGDLKPGGQVTYRVLYENRSQREADEATLDVTLPEGAGLVSSSSDGGSLAPSIASVLVRRLREEESAPTPATSQVSGLRADAEGQAQTQAQVPTARQRGLCLRGRTKLPGP